MKRLVGMILLMAMGLSVAAPIKSIVGGKHCGMSGAKLPYDAEVEYLEGVAYQTYIDLGRTATANTDVEVCFAPISGTGIMFGYRLNASGHYDIAVNLENNSPIIVLCAYSQPYTVPCTYGDYHTIITGKNGITVDGNVLSSASDGNVPRNRNLCLFTMIEAYQSSPVNTAYRINARCKYFNLYEAGELVMALIPVRKDGVGYMYDTISGEFYGNAGTGVFIIGPDKH